MNALITELREAASYCDMEFNGDDADVMRRAATAIERLSETVSLFRSAAVPVSTDLNPAGFEWCFAYLDQALESAGGPK